MKWIFKILVFLLIINLSIRGFAQDSTAVITSLHKNVKFDGVIKAKFETSANDGAMRFNIRNSRLGLRGNIGEYVSYRVQVELSNEGTLFGSGSDESHKTQQHTRPVRRLHPRLLPV